MSREVSGALWLRNQMPRMENTAETVVTIQAGRVTANRRKATASDVKTPTPMKENHTNKYSATEVRASRDAWVSPKTCQPATPPANGNTNATRYTTAHAASTHRFAPIVICEAADFSARANVCESCCVIAATVAPSSRRTNRRWAAWAVDRSSVSQAPRRQVQSSAPGPPPNCRRPSYDGDHAPQNLR